MNKQISNTLTGIGLAGLIMLSIFASLESYKKGRFDVCSDIGGQLYSGGYSDNKYGVCMFGDYGDAKITIVPEHNTLQGYEDMNRPRLDTDIDWGLE